MKQIHWSESLEHLRDRFRQDPAQSRALSHVVKFFLLMLVLTLVARGTAGATLARVELCTPSQQTMVQTLRATGTLEAQGRAAVAAPAGLTVEQVLVQPGTAVEEGETLAVLEPRDLADALARKTAQRQQLLVQLETLQEPQPVSDAAVTDGQRALDRANDAWDRAKAEATAAGEALERARQELREAQSALSAAPEAEREAAEAALRQAEALVQTAEADWSAAEAAATAAEQGAQDAGDRLDRAREDYAQAQKQARRTDETNEASADLLRLDLAAVDAEIEALLALQAADGRLTAPAGGRVCDLPLTEGMVTAGGERIAIATGQGGYLLTFQASPEEAEKLRTGGSVTVSQGDLSETVSVLPTASAGEGKEGVTFTATVTTPGWTDEPVEIVSELSRASYGTCVPVSALHRDAGGYFVYVFRSRLTILGLQNVAVRLDVTLLDTDGMYAAISGDLEPNESVISGSGKPLSDGDRVRVNP